MCNSLFIQRHGQSETNVSQVFTCRRLNPNLTEVGRKQAEDRAEFLKDIGIQRIVASPTRRTVQTATILSLATRASLEIDENLIEVDVGDLEGTSEVDPEKLGFFMEVMTEWLVNERSIQFPGGESLLDVRARLKKVRMKYMGSDAVPTVFVGHCAVFSVFMGMTNKFRLAEEGFLPNAGLARFSPTTETWEIADVCRASLHV